MTKRTSKQLMLWPLAVLSVCLIVLVGFVGAGLIRSFDNEAAQREQDLVVNGIDGRVAEIANAVVPQAIWGDAVRYLDNQFDVQWAQVNILNYLSESVGYHTVFVLDHRNRPVMAGADNRLTDVRHFSAFEPSASELIAAVRKAENARIAAGPPRDGRVSKTPIQAMAIARVNGELLILTATLVQPDFIDVRIRQPRAPVIIAGMRMESAFLRDFASRYLLKGLKIAEGEVPARIAKAALRDGKGRPIAWLCWQPQQPGAALLRKLAPIFALVGAVLLVVVVRLFRRSQRAAQGLIASEARAAHLAYHDALTGLANRVQFSDRLSLGLAQLRRTGQPLAVFCIDLDRFKEINDTYGHHVGDELLKEAARRMAAQCRSTDTFARLSGDEFAIVKIGGSSESAAVLAERLCNEIAHPFENGSARLRVGCSIGITIVADGTCDPAEILRQADIALYRAKETTKGSYCFFEAEMDTAIRNRRALETDLRDALEAGQMALVYQPQVNSRGEMTAVEALIRWRHAALGDVSPSYFVPIAEQCGLILALGTFSLRKAFDDSRRWPHLRIAINISAAQIRDPGFIGELRELIAEFNVDPGNFELEITEGVLLEDDPQTHERLADLRRLGFSLALDDFGTGYSSLSYLHRYPINKIKIDRSFIANLGIEDHANVVVGSIVKLARALHLQIVAEGVETQGQLDHLAKVGCSDVQGYFFSRPLSADAIDGLMRNSRPAFDSRLSRQPSRAQSR